MKKTMLAVFLALFAFGAVDAASLGEFRIKAPKPFNVGVTAMPAGEYTIEQVSPAGVLQVTNTATNASVMVIGSPISSAPGAEPGKATFLPVDGKYSLAQVFLPSGIAYGLPLHTAAR